MLVFDFDFFEKSNQNRDSSVYKKVKKNYFISFCHLFLSPKIIATICKFKAYSNLPTKPKR
jgi:hypothetical protein